MMLRVWTTEKNVFIESWDAMWRRKRVCEKMSGERKVSRREERRKKGLINHPQKFPRAAQDANWLRLLGTGENWKVCYGHLHNDILVEATKFINHSTTRFGARILLFKSHATCRRRVNCQVRRSVINSTPLKIFHAKPGPVWLLLPMLFRKAPLDVGSSWRARHVRFPQS